MASKELIQYIQNYHEKGYSIATLRSFLISRGYDALEVEEAIKVAYLPQHHTSKWIIPTLITMGGILLAGIAFFFIFSVLQDDVLLTTSSTAISTPKLNEPLLFRINVAGASSPTPIVISYEVAKEGELVDRNQQSADAMQRSFEYSFTPRQPGTYIVTTLVQDESNSYRSTFTIVVAALAQNTTPEVPMQNTTLPEVNTSINQTPPKEDTIVCGDNICNGEETISSCAADCKTAICGDTICDASETILSCRQDCEAKNSLNGMTRFEISQYVPTRVSQVGGSETAKECKTIAAVELADTCYFEIMRQTDEQSYCAFIGTPSKKDDCYIAYAFNVDDYSSCSLITDNYKKGTCDSLRRSWELQQQDA